MPPICSGGAGDVAQPALAAAATGSDPETATRAKVLLEKIRLGISPATPPETAAQIEAFHKGEIEVQLSVLHRLHEQKQHAAAIGLLRLLQPIRSAGGFWSANTW